MHRLKKIIEKPSRLVAGLMSGTSADAVDVVLLKIEGSGRESRFQQVTFQSFPHPAELKKRILHALEANTQELAELHREIAEVFADAVLKTLERASLKKEELDLVGSHGQTVYHHSGRGLKTSLQLGDGDWIAEKTGAVVVSDFRARDLAAGGEGAPISAYPDYLLFGRRGKNVAVLNLGGIANLTFLPNNFDQLLAFDIGPANMLIDGLMQHFSQGKEDFDRDGQFASQGKIQPQLLAWMLEHPFLKQAIPKSTGRETFGAEFLKELLKRQGKASSQDIVATASEFTAQAIRLAVEALPQKIEEVIVGGGGVRNPYLMERIRQALRPISVVETSEYGIDPQARESIAMAILANETLHGNPGNHPRATGAKRAVALGKISL